MARAAAEVIRVEIGAGDFAKAEKTANSVRGEKNLPLILLTMADAYAKRNAKSEELHALQAVAHVVAEKVPPEETVYAGWTFPDDWLPERSATKNVILTKIAQMQESLGDPAAAKLTAACVQPAVSGDWVALAEDLCNYRLVDLAKTLDGARASKSPSEIPGMISSAAAKFGKNLLRVEVMEAKLAAKSTSAR